MVDVDPVSSSWLRAKLSRKKRRGVPRVRAPSISPGQLQLPKPGFGAILREREEETARRVFKPFKDEEVSS